MAHLINPLARPSQLHHSATFTILPPDLQEAIFIATQCLTQAAGLLLDLPQSVTAQANVLLARYWLVTSPMAHEFSVCSLFQSFCVRGGQWLIFRPGCFRRRSVPCSQGWADTTLTTRHC